MSGGNERAVAVDEFDEIEAVVLGGAIGIVDIERRIGVGAGKIQSHAQGNVGVGDIFDLLDDDLAALGEFFFELRDERFGALAVHGFESVLRVVGDAVGDERDRSQHGDQEDQENFRAEAHGRPPDT